LRKGNTTKSVCLGALPYLEEGQQVLDVGTVAQGSAWGLVRQPVEVLGCLQDGAGFVTQQAQQLGFTAALDCLKGCQRPNCTCRRNTQISLLQESMVAHRPSLYSCLCCKKV